MRVLLVLALATFVPASRADEKLPDLVADTKAYRETFQEFVETLKLVTDKAAAERLMPRLKELGAKVDAETAALEKKFSKIDRGKRTAEQSPRWEVDITKLHALLQPTQKEFNALHTKLAATMPETFRAIGQIGPFRHKQETDEVLANINCRMIETASKAYYLKHGDWPTKLSQLTEGERPYLESPDAIKDPWGREFQFAVADDGDGQPRPFVWTISPYGDGKKVLGKAPPKK